MLRGVLKIFFGCWPNYYEPDIKALLARTNIKLLDIFSQKILFIVANPFTILMYTFMTMVYKFVMEI